MVEVRDVVEVEVDGVGAGRVQFGEAAEDVAGGAGHAHRQHELRPDQDQFLVEPGISIVEMRKAMVAVVVPALRQNQSIEKALKGGQIADVFCSTALTTVGNRKAPR